MADAFDLIVIGAGPGGYVAAIRAAQLGMKVACVEKRAALGGTCLNVGCIPSKALLDSSERFTETQAPSRRLRHAGRASHARPQEDDGAQDRRRQKPHRRRRLPLQEEQDHAVSRRGEARRRRQGRRQARRRHEPDAASARTSCWPPAASRRRCPVAVRRHHVVSSTEALAFDKVPTHLIVVGGGYIGLELGSVWARLGAKVTVLEFLPHILPLNDREIAGLLHKIAAEARADVPHWRQAVKSASDSGGQVIVNADRPRREPDIPGRQGPGRGRPPTLHRRAWASRKPASPSTSSPDRSPSNDAYQTNVPGIYAIGDLIAGPMLAHKAEDEGIACAEMPRRQSRARQLSHHPERDLHLARGIERRPDRGAGEGDGQRNTASASSRSSPMAGPVPGRYGRPGQDPRRCEDGPVLGVHIIGPRASDLIAEAVAVMEFGGTAEDIARTCHAHPTLSEAVREAALAVDGRAIHS